ncbi:hypothetical protein Aazo_3728 ['Nostoc azollae' 0708]|jgi:hypothetical protein|uniref:Uncharacterized protein n=1 Tax=Nostoc azollae (strain 0708) TaxID=551115 RepID=D7E454_NOSA0|nr:hypothetical protein Aazo_3728 ['Nostoc azollae' 0708]
MCRKQSSHIILVVSESKFERVKAGTLFYLLLKLALTPSSLVGQTSRVESFPTLELCDSLLTLKRYQFT